MLSRMIDPKPRNGWRPRVLAVLGLMAFGLSLAATPAVAKTIYVSPVGSDANSCASAQSRTNQKQTIADAKTCLAPGDTLVLGDGVYAGAANEISEMPDGTLANYITVKAEHDGGAILTAGMTLLDSYLQFEGLRFSGPHQKMIGGHHLKFLRTQFNGGPEDGNNSNVAVAQAADILLEDVWLHGPGARYNLLVWRSNRVIVRRAVIRHDAGWSDPGNPGNLPEAGLAFYDSADAHAQNVIVIDSNLPYDYWYGAVYNLENANLNANNGFKGVIALNTAGVCFASDHDVLNTTWEDIVCWDNQNGGLVMSGAGWNVNRVTIGRTNMTPEGDFRGGFGFWGSGLPVVTNSIVYNMGNAAAFNTGLTYSDTYGNPGSASGEGQISIDPLVSGLTYLARIENGSPLKTQGLSGGQMGAQIVNRTGVSGTLFGEPGWNQATMQPLWPWAHQERIKAEMCTEPGVTRGFCSDSSLTHYIWNYLGNGSPFEGLPGPPTNPRLVSP